MRVNHAATRRQTLQWAGIAAAAAVLAPRMAFADEKTVADELKKLYADKAMTPGKIKLDVPQIAENGLVVPVIKNAEKKGVFEIAKESGELAKQARDGKLKPADMSGACFTISSLGGIGGTYFAPIVNAPEVAILGVSKSVMKPVWNGREFIPRLILPLSLSADHRVIDGATATRFNAYVAQLLADLRRALI